jgi:hypothetical protein
VIEPAEPKWGETIRLIYRADLPDATLHANDNVIALVTIAFPGRYAQTLPRLAFIERFDGPNLYGGLSNDVYLFDGRVGGYF